MKTESEKGKLAIEALNSITEKSVMEPIYNYIAELQWKVEQWAKINEQNLKPQLKPDSKKTLQDALSKIIEDDALFIGKSILKWERPSDESIIHQVKNELLSSPNFWVSQTNLSGSDWLKIFQYLQMNGYEINTLY
ncbi:MAG: hypothetical protein WC055_02170 [Melioribacteraceae bacterium]